MSHDYLFIVLICFRFIVYVIRPAVQSELWLDVSRLLNRVMLGFCFCFITLGFCVFGHMCLLCLLCTMWVMSASNNVEGQSDSVSVSVYVDDCI